MLASAGFAAIGTTSAGIAYGRALPDYEGALSREHGTFRFAEQQVPDDALCRFFSARIAAPDTPPCDPPEDPN